MARIDQTKAHQLGRAMHEKYMAFRRFADNLNEKIANDEALSSEEHATYRSLGDVYDNARKDWWNYLTGNVSGD